MYPDAPATTKVLPFGGRVGRVEYRRVVWGEGERGEKDDVKGRKRAIRRMGWNIVD